MSRCFCPLGPGGRVSGNFVHRCEVAIATADLVRRGAACRDANAQALSGDGVVEGLWRLPGATSIIRSEWLATIGGRMAEARLGRLGP